MNAFLLFELALHLLYSVNADVTVSTLFSTDRQPNRNLPRSQPILHHPHHIAVGLDESLYITDGPSHRICKLSQEGQLSVLAGKGKPGNRNGQATTASFYFPAGIAIDSHGNVFVSDSLDKSIRMIDRHGLVSTLTTTDMPFALDASPTDTPELTEPVGMAVDARNNLYVADKQQNRIFKITRSGDVSVYAGSGDEGHDNGSAMRARFHSPLDVAIDSRGNVLVADTENHCIKRITRDGYVSIVAGGPTSGFLDGQSNQARFRYPRAIAIDRSRNIIYVADTDNHAVRAISADGTVTTVAGTGICGHANGDDQQAMLCGPKGITYHRNTVYVADSINRSIRKIVITGPLVPRRPVSPRPIRYNDEICFICHDVKQPRQKYCYCSERCGTSFHPDCAQRWVDRNREPTCPICRTRWIQDRQEVRIPSTNPSISPWHQRPSTS